MTKVPRFFSVLLAAALLAGLLFSGAAPAQASDPAALSPALAEWLATAAPDATFQTIVTFDSYSGMSRLDSLGVANQKLSRLPIAFATLTAAQINTIAAWPETRSLWHDQQNEIYLDESVPLTGANRVWTGEGDLRGSYTGLGVNVAVIDTGVDVLHPDLAGQVTAFTLAGSPFETEPMVFLPTSTDTYGHGTHVSSTIAGTGAASGGRYMGMAPGAHIYSFKTDVGAFLLNSYALASFDWILAHPEANIRVSSNSWGCCDGSDYDPNDPVNVATKILYDAGVTVVFAASNSGGPNTLNIYATSPWVISVAAGTKELTLASFSSRGRIGDNWDRREAQANNTGIYRPTITAPGDLINAAKSSTAVVMASGVDPENPHYTVASGTSMATPHVAGAIALMLQARPELKPQHIIDILEGTADNLPSYEIFEVGMGHLDAYGAVLAAEKGKIKFPPSINGKTPQFTQLSSSPFNGTVIGETWTLSTCQAPLNPANHHQFTVTSADVIYAEIDWGDPNQLVYLRLYDPNCNVAAESAALLDITSVSQRAVVVTSPVPGVWTVGVYGRINALSNYVGAFSTFDKK